VPVVSPSLRPGLAALTVVASVAAAPLHAQRGPVRDVSLSAGAMSFDGSGTGMAPTAALRASLPLAGRWLLVEGGAAYASLDEQFVTRPTRVGIAEAQLQVQAPLGVVRPYLGVGGGWLAYLTNAIDGQKSVEGTVSVAGGVRVDVSRVISLRSELRVRGWHAMQDGFGFVNSAAEFTGGVAYHF
jgi:hypothetical protein